MNIQIGCYITTTVYYLSGLKSGRLIEMTGVGLLMLAGWLASFSSNYCLNNQHYGLSLPAHSLAVPHTAIHSQTRAILTHLR